VNLDDGTGVPAAHRGIPAVMSDVDPGENTDQPTPAEEEPTPAERERPEERAHGGSMAPGLVDPTGRRTTGLPATDPGE
jgi:hypothetical protein